MHRGQSVSRHSESPDRSLLLLITLTQKLMLGRPKQYVISPHILVTFLVACRSTIVEVLPSICRPGDCTSTSVQYWWDGGRLRDASYGNLNRTAEPPAVGITTACIKIDYKNVCISVRCVTSRTIEGVSVLSDTVCGIRWNLPTYASYICNQATVTNSWL